MKITEHRFMKDMSLFVNETVQRLEYRGTAILNMFGRWCKRRWNI